MKETEENQLNENCPFCGHHWHSNGKPVQCPVCKRYIRKRDKSRKLVKITVDKVIPQ